MTQQIYSRSDRSLNIYYPDRAASISIVGDPAAYYIFIGKQGSGSTSSQWIRGAAATWHEFSRLHTERKKRKFRELAEKLARENK